MRVSSMALLAFVFFATTPSALAAVNAALRPFYDTCLTGAPTAATASAGGTGTITPINADGSDPRQYSYQFLAANLGTVMQGASTETIAMAAAGIVGNLMAENGAFNLSLCNSSNHCGLAQWSTGRFSDLSAQGFDPNTYDGQLGFIIYEIGDGQQGKCGTTQDLLMKATSPEAAATAFNCSFEISGDNSGTRERNAAQVYADFSGLPIPAAGSVASNASVTDANNGQYCAYITGSTTSPAGSTNAGATTGSVDCANETGKAKILCEAEPYDVSPYVWGGGHGGYSAFKAACPSPNSTAACGLDCSGLISIAASAAFGQSYSWSSGSFASSSDWAAVPISSAQPGDVLWRPGHVGIFKSASNGTITVFQAASPSLGIGTFESNNWQAAYTYVGAGV